MLRGRSGALELAKAVALAARARSLAAEMINRADQRLLIRMAHKPKQKPLS